MSYEPPNSGEQPAYQPPAYQPPAPPQPPAYQPPAAQPQLYPAQPQPYQAPPQPYQAQPGQPPAYQPAPQNPPYASYAQPGYNPQGYPVASYPGYGGTAQVASAGVSGVAIAAIIVSSIAFLSGWFPFVGAPLAVVGLILSILAIRGGRGKVLGIIGTVLSSLSLLAGILIFMFVFALTTGDFGSGGYGAAPAVVAQEPFAAA